MRIARAVIAPDAATHRVKGRVDRSDSRPSRRMGCLSSWRRAFCRLAFQPRGVCADTGDYAVFKEQRRERRISLSYTSRKIGLFITPSVEIFQNSLQAYICPRPRSRKIIRTFRTALGRSLFISAAPLVSKGRSTSDTKFSVPLVLKSSPLIFYRFFCVF